MKLMKLNKLNGHDVYEFCCAGDYPNKWNNTSLFISTEDFLLLSPYIDVVFPHYHYYGPQKVKRNEWEKIKNLYLPSQNKNDSISNFFMKIEDWLSMTNGAIDYFWIFGV